MIRKLTIIWHTLLSFFFLFSVQLHQVFILVKRLKSEHISCIFIPLCKLLSFSISLHILTTFILFPLWKSGVTYPMRWNLLGHCSTCELRFVLPAWNTLGGVVPLLNLLFFDWFVSINWFNIVGPFQISLALFLPPNIHQKFDGFLSWNWVPPTILVLSIERIYLCTWTFLVRRKHELVGGCRLLPLFSISWWFLTTLRLLISL